MNQTDYFVITRLHRDDLKARFPEVPETIIEALSDEVMETIARQMHELDWERAFWDRLGRVTEPFLTG